MPYIGSLGPGVTYYTEPRERERERDLVRMGIVLPKKVLIQRILDIKIHLKKIKAADGIHYGLAVQKLEHITGHDHLTI